MSVETKSDGAAKPARPLLMIPGPIEYHEKVLATLGEPSVSHVSPSFIAEFSSAIKNVRHVFLTKDAQPVILAGSGTLGWDLIAANLVEPGHKALVVNTGYFSDSFAACCSSYGVSITEVKAPVGGRPDMKELEAALKADKYNIVTLTHVDTSTSVKNDIKALSALIHSIQPEALIAVDGVCSFGAEEFRMDDWGIDAAMTCSQKALGVPPGLCIVAFSKRAMTQFAERKTAVHGYFQNLNNWLPIMKKYEAKEASYFATPNVNLVRALNVGLQQLLDIGMENVFKKQEQANAAFKAAVKALNLQIVPLAPEFSATTLSAIRYPKGVKATDLLPKMTANGIVVAGGLHKQIKDEYFRVGHMGVSALEPSRGHLTKVVEALEASLAACGHEFKKGAGLEALAAGLKA